MRCLLVLLLIALNVAAADRKAENVSKRTQALFEWFDRLDFTDVKQAKFVRIWTGGSAESGDKGRPVKETIDGFLLSEDGATFRVVLGDLNVAAFEKHGANEGEEDYVGYREISLVDEARSLLSDVKRRDYLKRWTDGEWRYFDRLPRRSQIFVIARECARRGHGQLAEALVEAIARMDNGSSSPETSPMAEWLQEDFAGVLDWQAACAFRDPGCGWPDLLAKFQRIIRDCPKAGSYRLDRARKMAAAIENNIAALAGHARGAPASLDGMPPEDQAHELVWRLRDDRDEESDKNDMWPRPWPGEGLKGNGALAGLKALGFAAVPALIECAEQEMPTRCVTRSTRYGGGIWFSTTRDLAMQALNDIAGINFYWQVPNIGMIKRDESWPKVRAVMTDWWREVQAKGERQWLIENVEAGKNGADDCARRLAKRFPDDLPGAVSKGVRASTDLHAKIGLIKLLWPLRDPQSNEFLRDEVRNGAALADRVAAAYGLRLRGIPEGLKAMLDEWGRLDRAAIQADAISLGPNEPPSMPVANTGPATADSATHLIGFLASCDSPEAIRAFADHWTDLPMQARREFVDQVEHRDFSFASDTEEAAGPATQAAIEDVLLNALADTVDFPGEAHSGSSGTFFDPRLCDLAGNALQQHWPGKYHFDVAAPFATRERQRIECRNVRLREMGIDPLPIPPQRPKLPRAEGNRVVAIEWADGSAKPTDALTERLRRIEGKAIGGKILVTLLTSFAAKPSKGLRALHLRAERADDLTGVVLTMRLISGDVHPESGCSKSDAVLRGRVSKHFSSGTGMRSYAVKPSEWEDFRVAADAALADPFEEAATIIASVAFD